MGLAALHPFRRNTPGARLLVDFFPDGPSTSPERAVVNRANFQRPGRRAVLPAQQLEERRHLLERRGVMAFLAAARRLGEFAADRARRVGLGSTEEHGVVEDLVETLGPAAWKVVRSLWPEPGDQRTEHRANLSSEKGDGWFCWAASRRSRIIPSAAPTNADVMACGRSARLKLPSF